MFKPPEQEKSYSYREEGLNPFFDSQGNVVNKSSRGKALATPTFFTATSYQQDTPPSSTSSNQAFSFLSNNPVETGVDLNPESGEETLNVQGSTEEATITIESFAKL